MEYIKSERDDLRKDVTTLRVKLSEINSIRRTSIDSEASSSPYKQVHLSKTLNYVSIGTQTVSVSHRQQFTQTTSNEPSKANHFTQTISQLPQCLNPIVTSSKACQSLNNVHVDTVCQTDDIGQSTALSTLAQGSNRVTTNDIGVMTESYGTTNIINDFGHIYENSDIKSPNIFQSPMIFDHSKEIVTEIYYNEPSNELQEEL
jgi:hypothetical protein